MTTFKDWFDEHLGDYVEDIATYGCSSGFPYITYYKDTTKIFDEFEDELFELVGEQAENCGYDNVFELLGGCKNLDNSLLSFKNLMVWYSCEELVHKVVETNEQREEEEKLLRDQWPEVRAMIVEKYGEDDEIALNEGFNDWTDALCTDGDISEYVCDNVTREDVER